jgi:putative membrane protein
VIRRFLLLWAANVAAIFIASIFVEGINYEDDWWVLILAGLVFGIVNSLVRPLVRGLLKSVGAPIVVLTLGVALFFVNVLMLYITSWIVPDFEIESFGSALAGAAIIWIVHTLLELAFGIGRRERR